MGELGLGGKTWVNLLLLGLLGELLLEVVKEVSVEILSSQMGAKTLSVYVRGAIVEWE